MQVESVIQTLRNKYTGRKITLYTSSPENHKGMSVFTKKPETTITRKVIGTVVEVVSSDSGSGYRLKLLIGAEIIYASIY